MCVVLVVVVVVVDVVDGGGVHGETLQTRVSLSAEKSNRSMTAHNTGPYSCAYVYLNRCDLLKIGSFGNAMHGCKTVLHTASPFYSQGGTEEALVKPAVDGTRNVLTSCVAHEVENVVLTASTANVYVVYGTCTHSSSCCL